MAYNVLFVTIIIILAAASLISQLISNRLALKEYHRSNSTANALHKMKLWYTVQFIVNLFAGALFGIYVWIFFSELIESAIMVNVIGIFSIMLYLFVFDLIDIAISQNTYRIIKSEQLSLTETAIETAKEYSLFTLFLLPIGMFLWLINLINIEDNILMTRVLQVVLIVVLIGSGEVMEMIILFIMSLFSKKATVINDDKIVMYAFENVPDYIKKKVEVYITQDQDPPSIVIDALLVKKKIFITDELIEACSKEELKAVLLHEIGHIKHRHLFKESSRNITVTALILLTSALLYSLAADDYYYHKIYEIFGDTVIFIVLEILVVGIGVFLFGFLLYDLTIGRAAISRNHEKEADEYALKNGVEPQTLISALQKMHEIDDTPESLNKLEEKFSTHPSLENRIKQINGFTKPMEKIICSKKYHYIKQYNSINCAATYIAMIYRIV